MTVWDSERWTAADAEAQWVSPEGAAWLASASPFPRSVRALWSAKPWAPSVLPCGTRFDVLNLPALFGRQVLDQLASDGPGCGPAAVHRGRLLIFCTPGSADRIPSLMRWEEWAHLVPPMLCHGAGDAVTVPPMRRTEGVPSCWVIAPDSTDPYLPGPEALLWACIRAARALGTVHAVTPSGHAAEEDDELLTGAPAASQECPSALAGAAAPLFSAAREMDF